jgi:hypothetical protein
MARKLPGIQRIVGPEAIYAIVYGEISSSLYFALGVVALVGPRDDPVRTCSAPASSSPWPSGPNAEGGAGGRPGRRLLGITDGRSGTWQGSWSAGRCSSTSS